MQWKASQKEGWRQTFWCEWILFGQWTLLALLLGFLSEHLPFWLTQPKHSLASTASIHAQNSYNTIVCLLTQCCLLSYRYKHSCWYCSTALTLHFTFITIYSTHACMSNAFTILIACLLLFSNCSLPTFSGQLADVFKWLWSSSQQVSTTKCSLRLFQTSYTFLKNTISSDLGFFFTSSSVNFLSLVQSCWSDL